MRYSLVCDQLRFTPENSRLISLELSLKRDGKRISTLETKLYDPDDELAEDIRDPSYTKVLVSLFLAPDGNDGIGTEVFRGWLHTIGGSQPSGVLSLVAYDKSLELRRNKRYKTFSKLTSVQLVQQVASSYGLSVNVDTADAIAKLRTFDVGANISDWDQMVRALAADGLYMYEAFGVIHVRRNPLNTYQKEFKKGDPLINLDWSVQRGESAQVVTQQPLEHQSSFRAATGAENAEAQKQESSRTTHSSPGVAGTSSGQAHAEQIPQDSASMVAQERRRKDSATLTIPLTPDINQDHKIRISGYNRKVNGNWYAEEIKHKLLGDYSSTALSLTHSISQEAIKTTSLPLQQ